MIAGGDRHARPAQPGECPASGPCHLIGEGHGRVQTTMIKPSAFEQRQRQQR